MTSQKWFAPNAQLLTRSILIGVRIAQVAFDCEVVSETVQVQMLNPKGWMQSRARGEWNGGRIGEDLGCVIKKNLVYQVGGQRCSIHVRAALDQQRRDLQFTQAAQNRAPIRPVVRPCRRDDFHPNSELS